MQVSYLGAGGVAPQAQLILAKAMRTQYFLIVFIPNQ